MSVVALALVLSFLAGSYRAQTHGARAQSGGSPTPTDTPVPTPRVQPHPAHFPITRQTTTWRGSKIVSTTVTATKNISCSDRQADAYWFDGSLACTVSTTRMPLQPLAVGYFWQEKASGPWYSDSQYPRYHLRWNRGQLEFSVPDVDGVVTMAKGTTVRYYAIIAQGSSK